MAIPDISVLPVSALDALAAPDRKRAQALLAPYLDASRHKVVVLDDDPTGIQTVHDISVYTNWSERAVLDGFREDAPLFFILTNSRSFPVTGPAMSTGS